MSVIGLGLVGVATWGVTHSRIFEMRSLKVTGNVRLSSSDVAALGRLDSRTNVLWLSGGALERRLEADPWIRDAQISRTLPSFISIAIVERTPAAVLAGSRALVSSDGIILGRAGDTARLPVIAAEAQPKVVSGRLPIELPALRVVRSLPASLIPSVARIGVDGSGQLTLSLRDGTRVVLGDADEVGPKAAALQALLRWIDRTGVGAAYIDVTVPTAPALLPADGSPANPQA
jgi:cell division protein FtsQ